MNGQTEAVITLVVRGTIGYKDNTATLTSGAYTVSEAERTLFYDPSNPPGSITFTKNAVPDSLISFDFTGGLGNFTLTDDGIHNGTPLVYNVNFGDKTVPPRRLRSGRHGSAIHINKGLWLGHRSKPQSE